ncbi:hypothetical protein ACWGID_16195 [Kribbella sp. NPDC054772]
MYSLPVERFCTERDTLLKVEEVVVVAWPPYGATRSGVAPSQLLG